ncbi:MAG: hypothetical protein OXP12_03550 [Thaumarchaeota archaeon]|nr:hypothetical protein [Nitrososphaerota archaeon]MDE0266042.1 hypothetical protein [Nitrososphaerota archaeon]
MAATAVTTAASPALFAVAAAGLLMVAGFSPAWPPAVHHAYADTPAVQIPYTAAGSPFTLGASDTGTIGMFYFDASFEGTTTPVSTEYGDYYCVGWEARCQGLQDDSVPIIVFLEDDEGRDALVNFTVMQRVLGDENIGPSNTVSVSESDNIAVLPEPPGDFGVVTHIAIDFRIDGKSFKEALVTDPDFEGRRVFDYDFRSLQLGDDAHPLFSIVSADGPLGPDVDGYYAHSILDAPLTERAGTIQIPHRHVLALDQIDDDRNIGVIIGFVNAEFTDYTPQYLADADMPITFNIWAEPTPPSVCR